MTDISVHEASKQFGLVRAVQDLTFEVPAGKITGFLGPNGGARPPRCECCSAWSHRPTASSSSAAAATRTCPFRAASSGPCWRRPDSIPAADGGRRVGGYSMGMRQRLGLAGALLGNPDVLILDEPGNCLDPGGMAWLRAMLQQFAAQGRTVLVSSHVLSEVAQTVDRRWCRAGSVGRSAGCPAVPG